MSTDNNSKLDKLYTEYLNFISSKEESRSFLKAKGLDPDALAKETIRKAKQIQMKLASRKTEKEYQELKTNLLEKVKEQVEKILNDVSFNLETFIKQEKINLAYKNFESMSREEIKEFLERHYLLKFEKDTKEKAAE